MSDPFDLLPEDIEYLNSNYQDKWDKLHEGPGKYGLIIYKFPIPIGYKQSNSDLLVLIPSGYPTAQLDMFYFDPPLCKLNELELPAISYEEHFERLWQRWSRHYEWILGEDNLIRHIEYIKVEILNAIS